MSEGGERSHEGKERLGHGEDTDRHLRRGVEEHGTRALGEEEAVPLREARERDGGEEGG